MKTAAFASALLATAALAQPHPRGHGRLHKNAARDVVTKMVTVTVIAYVDENTTLLITDGQGPTAKSDSQPELANTTTTTPAAQQPTLSPVAANLVSPVLPPEAISPTDVPTATPSPAPETTTPAYVSPATSSPAPEPTTSTYVPPPVAAPASSGPGYLPPLPVPPPKSNPSPGGGSGELNSGQITYYDVGLGSCGETNSGTENVVALSHLFMGEASNGNEYCGATVTIYANGKNATATVKDKCMGCKMYDIDVSRSVFTELRGSLEEGRANIQWTVTKTPKN